MLLLLLVPKFNGLSSGCSNSNASVSSLQAPLHAFFYSPERRRKGEKQELSCIGPSPTPSQCSRIFLANANGAAALFRMSTCQQIFSLTSNTLPAYLCETAKGFGPSAGACYRRTTCTCLGGQMTLYQCCQFL